MRSHATFLSTATLFVALAVAQQAVQTGARTVPQLIPYSGIAKDVSGKPLSGVVGITFLLYQQEQGGSPLWLETQSVQADSRGHYSVQLGATLPNGVPNDLFVSGEARWLGIQIAGQPEASRVMLLSVPYAMKAGDAQTLAGLPASAFVLAAPMNGSASGTAMANTAPSSSAAPATITSNVTTTGGTVNAIPLFTAAANIQTSAITQTGTGATSKAFSAQCPLGNATLAAPYIVFGTGTIIGKGPVTVVGVNTWDGQGNTTATYTASVNGNVYPGVTVTGSYTVSSDCTGSVSESDGSHYNFVALPDGNGTTWIQTDAGTVVSGTETRLRNREETDVRAECNWKTRGTTSP